MPGSMRYPVAGDRPLWFTQASSSVTVTRVDLLGSPAPNTEPGFVRFTFEYEGPDSSALRGTADGA